MTSSAACSIALPSLGSRAPSSVLTVAAARLRIPNARMTGGGRRS